MILYVVNFNIFPTDLEFVISACESILCVFSGCLVISRGYGGKSGGVGIKCLDKIWMPLLFCVLSLIVLL